MEYKIYHTFKPNVLVPLCAISPNTSWIFDKEEKVVKTSDGVLAVVEKEMIVHFLDEKTSTIVEKLYNTDLLSFGRRWNKSLPLTTMEFCYMKLRKIEEELNNENEVKE